MVYTTAVGASADSTAATDATNTSPVRGNTLGTDAFLNLLVTQIRYQDPLSGQQDTGEMIVQLSLFTLLEQIIKLQAQAEKQYAVMQSTQAFTLLNKEVVVETEYGYFNGIVTGVNLLGEQPVIVLDGLAEFPLSSVVMVNNASAPPVEEPPVEEPPVEEPPEEAPAALDEEQRLVADEAAEPHADENLPVEDLPAEEPAVPDEEEQPSVEAEIPAAAEG